MFCRKCGNQFDNSLNFCPKCNEPAPETARINGVNVEPPVSPAVKKCPQCLHDNKPEAKFCAACGADLTKDQQSADSAAFTSPEFNGTSDYGDAGFSMSGDGTAAAKSGLPVKAIIIGAAAIVILLIILLIFLLGGSGSKKPVPALLKAAENLSDEIKDAKGMHIEIEVDGEKGEIDYQLNVRKEKFVFYAEIGDEEIGGYIYEDEGRVALDYGGDIMTQKLRSSDADTFWSAIENDDYEDNDLLTTYLDSKKVDKAVKSVTKGLKSKDFQNDFADALGIEYDNKGSEYTYSAELSGKNIAKAMEVLLEMVEERTEDYAESEFEDMLDEAFDSLKELKSDAGSESLGDVEWVIKKGKLQSFEYEYEYYDDWNEETEKSSVSGELEYGFGGLKSIEIKGNIDGDKFSVEISDIDKVDDVEDLMSKSMLKELKLD